MTFYAIATHDADNQLVILPHLGLYASALEATQIAWDYGDEYVTVTLHYKP